MLTQAVDDLLGTPTETSERRLRDPEIRERLLKMVTGYLEMRRKLSAA